MNVDGGAGLVQALLRGDPDACDRLVERYGERVYRLASHLTGTADDAEEAAQSALVTAIRTIGALQTDSTFASWLDGLAARAAYSRMLARGQKSETIAIDSVLPPIDASGHFEPMNDWSAGVESPELQGELRHAMTRDIQALQPDETATTVRVRNGKVFSTDGPFAETKEQLGGFMLIEARDLNEAIQLAAKTPMASRGSIEVRPIREIRLRGGDDEVHVHDLSRREPARGPARGREADPH